MQKATEYWRTGKKGDTGIPDNVEGKFWSMADFCTEHDDDHVPDPYFEGGFDNVFDMLTDAANGLLKHLREGKAS